MRTIINFETDGSGDAEVVKETAFLGSILHAVQIDGANLDDNAVFTLDLVAFDGSTVLATLLTDTLTPAKVHRYYPRTLEHGADGSALATTTIPILEGYLKVTIASGGNTKAGIARIYTTEL